MRFCIILTIVILSYASIYNPGINVMSKDVLIQKMKREVIPKVMEAVKTINVPDLNMSIFFTHLTFTIWLLQTSAY